MTAATGILIPLFLTIALESVVLVTLTPLPWTAVLPFSALINTVTLPPATFLYHEVLPDLLIVEILVMIAETFLITLLFRFPVRKSLVLSIAANGTTALTGVLLAGFF